MTPRVLWTLQVEAAVDRVTAAAGAEITKTIGNRKGLSAETLSDPVAAAEAVENIASG